LLAAQEINLNPGKRVANNNSLRIIGGIWRSRRIHFIDSPEIRPTPDRVRETVFNWLAAYIHGAKCLDLFAGSGALGFEAKSRGARKVVLVEKDPHIAATLNEQKNLLSAQENDQQIEISNQNALTYLHSAKQPFDIIFLDPPFASDLIEQVVVVVIERQLLSENGLLYIESASHQELPEELKTLNCIREKITGEVRYAVYKSPANEQ